jgi:hypothetical protein
VGPTDKLEHGTHLGARGRWPYRAGCHLVWNAAGRPVPLDRSRAKLGNDPDALGSSQAQDLPGIHSICVDPRNSQRVWIAVSTGGIWFTEDSGANWTQRGDGMRAEYAPPEQTHDPIVQDVHCLVQCPAAPQRMCMWVQHHNGIFISSDEGKTFTGAEADILVLRQQLNVRSDWRSATLTAWCLRGSIVCDG